MDLHSSPPATRSAPRRHRPTSHSTGRLNSHFTSPSASRLTSIVKGAVVLVAIYTLAGAGIGALAGSAIVGVFAGLACGICAISAILLISGAAIGRRAAAEPVQLPVGGPAPQSAPKPRTARSLVGSNRG